MRSHDPYVRLSLDRILAGHGEVLQEFPLRPRATRRVDALFVPGPPRDDAIPLGEMARITARPAALEAFSGSVSVSAYQQVLSKTLDLRHAAERRRATEAERALRGVVAWMLCTAHPSSLLRETRAMRMADAPSGFYELAAAHPVVVVSLGELPEGESTLMLRLLAAELRPGAATELRQRARRDPRLAPLMHAVLEYLADLLEVAPGGPHMLDVATEVKKYVDYLKRTNYRRGLRKGMREGMREGIAPLLRLFARRVGRELTDQEHAVVVARLATLGADRLGDVVLDLPATELAAWLADPSAT